MTWTPARLARGHRALTRKAAPCPAYSASRQLEHTRRTATRPRPIPPWEYVSASKEPG